jgi:hypothetical protein
MRSLKLLVLLGLGLLVATYAHAQGGPDPNYDPNYNPNYDPGYQDPGYQNPAPAYAYPAYVGPPPVCPYGYYDYYPYACVPYGYYGPSWFSDGVFIGVGPWGRGWRGRYRGFGGGYRGWGGGREYGGRGYYGNGPASRSAACGSSSMGVEVGLGRVKKKVVPSPRRESIQISPP